MQWWSVAALIVCVVILTCCADAVSVSSAPDPDAAAADYNRKNPVSQGVLTLLQDSMKQGDSVLKEQLKDSIDNLKQLLEGKDLHLDERISDVLARSKVQDDQLKEDHADDIAWLKERLTKGLNYLKEEIKEDDEKTNEKLTKIREAFWTRPCSTKEWNHALVDDLRQQVTDYQAEMMNIKQQLQTTQTELNLHQETLQSTRADLNTTWADLNTTRTDLETTRANFETAQVDFETTRADLQTTRADLETTRADLETTQVDFETTRADLETTRADLETTQTKLQMAEQEIRSLKVEMDSVQSNQDLVTSEMGSTFTRWGRTTCPDNTSLVYTGYVGGQKYNHTGGGSNYLCLVKDPQLDNMTLPLYYNHVYGAEYQRIDNQNDQDAVCSVCRAPQTSTLMIPATLSCPSGWTTQYRGHLVSGHHSHKGRTEFVCLDQIREHRQGGQANENGVLLYHVISDCGSLPCPPYVNKKVVTCVVCSL